MLVKYLTLATLVVLLSINVTGCTSIDYVYNDTLVKKGLISQEVADRETKKKKDNLFYIPKQLGGIKIKDSSAPGGERLFVLTRNKSAVMAETQIYDGDNKYFNRAYMSVGGSTKDYVGVQFRLEDDAQQYFEKAYLHIGANKKKERVGFELRFVY